MIGGSNETVGAWGSANGKPVHLPSYNAGRSLAEKDTARVKAAEAIYMRDLDPSTETFKNPDATLDEIWDALQNEVYPSANNGEPIESWSRRGQMVTFAMEGETVRVSTQIMRSLFEECGWAKGQGDSAIPAASDGGSQRDRQKNYPTDFYPE